MESQCVYICELLDNITSIIMTLSVLTIMKAPKCMILGNSKSA